MREEGADAGKGAARPPVPAVRATDVKDCTSGMPGQPSDRRQQQRPAGNCLPVLVRIGEAREQVPPVEYQCQAARHNLTAILILGRKAAPSPLILQFIEVVFAIAAVTIQMQAGEDFQVQSSDESCAVL